jgi:hypothetical protein
MPSTPRSEDRIDQIFEGLKQKSSVKQTIYRNTKEIFERMKLVSIELAKNLSERMAPVDANVMIEFKNVNEFEFQVKFSGDLLVFVMHSNIVTLPQEHAVMNNAYVKQDFSRGYFGHIMAYNFMADSIKYSRMSDPGYLLGRMLINVDCHFFLEGVKEMDLSKQDISKNKVTDKLLRLIVESAMIACINNDLMAPELEVIQKISVRDKIENQQVSKGTKLGFDFTNSTSNGISA